MHHSYIHMTSPDGKTHKHFDHVLVDKRQYSIIVDVQSSRGAGYVNDHYLVVAEVRDSQ
jgi:endonuclease/exonuclease/phosphatase family metal-dependent hydrolase